MELSEKDRAAMAAMDAAINVEHRTQGAIDDVVLGEVRAAVSADVFAAIQQEFHECSHVFDFAIANTPKGEPQDDGAPWGMTYVNQTLNGGYTGDSFGGTVSIPLGNGKFFQYGYAM